MNRDGVGPKESWSVAVIGNRMANKGHGRGSRRVCMLGDKQTRRQSPDNNWHEWKPGR